MNRKISNKSQKLTSSLPLLLWHCLSFTNKGFDDNPKEPNHTR